MTFFVSAKWGKSEDKRQDEGLRQGDPLSCFLLVILMTIIMLDAREQYTAECNRRGTTEAQRETKKRFGFDDPTIRPRFLKTLQYHSGSWRGLAAPENISECPLVLGRDK